MRVPRLVVFVGLGLGLVACGGDDDDIDDSVPANAYCTPVAGFTTGALEDEVLRLVNDARARGATCGTEVMPPVPALTVHPALRCAARVHSADMRDRNFFDHTNPDGKAPWDRMELAGYPWMQAGENIAGGNATAAATMQQWMNSPGHCLNIMGEGFVHLGVGTVADDRLWTQVFGAPP